MPNIKSQKKRVLISQEEKAANGSKKSAVKTAMKKYEAAIAAGNTELAGKLLPETVSIIDRATSDGVYHKNNAAHKKARLAKMLAK